MPENPHNPILSFTREYRFLSNFWLCEVPYQGIIYPSSEHAYQAAKSPVTEVRMRIRDLKKPIQAKRYGDDLPRIQPISARVSVMREIVRSKFFYNTHLAAKLLATNNRHLIEGNTWGDEFWGCVNGHGDNRLGTILEQVRYELKMKKDRENAEPAF